MRLAATRESPERLSLYRHAMASFAAEPSARVRRGIADLWVRLKQRDGRTTCSEALPFLADEDSDVRKIAAAHVLEATLQPRDDAEALRVLAREAARP